MPSPNTFTLLEIEGLTAPYAVRGLTQTLEFISAAGQLRRTINGGLKDVTAPQFRKYRSVISCADNRVPAIDGVWKGQQLVVSCVHYLAYPVGGTPQRVVVPGSSFTEEGFVYYRPRLTMRVVNFNGSEAEYQAQNSWSLELEEI